MLSTHAICSGHNSFKYLSCVLQTYCELWPTSLHRIPFIHNRFSFMISHFNTADLVQQHFLSTENLIILNHSCHNLYFMVGNVVYFFISESNCLQDSLNVTFRNDSLYSIQAQVSFIQNVSDPADLFMKYSEKN